MRAREAQFVDIERGRAIQFGRPKGRHLDVDVRQYLGRSVGDSPLRDFFESWELLAMSDVAQFTDGNFETEVLQSDQPVLVDFWATWCGPCRQIAPMIDELATENIGVVKVGKLNIDESPGIAQQYKVFSIPTLVLFKGGEDVERFVGVQPKAKIQEAMDSHK